MVVVVETVVALGCIEIMLCCVRVVIFGDVPVGRRVGGIKVDSDLRNMNMTTVSCIIF